MDRSIGVLVDRCIGVVVYCFVFMNWCIGLYLCFGLYLCIGLLVCIGVYVYWCIGLNLCVGVVAA